MSLVKATTDPDFIVETSQKIDEFNQHMRDHTAAMIEEYLRRRTQQIREAVEAEMNEAFDTERKAWGEERMRMNEVAAQADRLRHQVLRAAEVLENQSNRIAGIVAFRRWVAATMERRALREKAAVAENHARGLLLCRAATRWRLFTLAAQEKKRHEAELQSHLCAAEEQRGEVEQLHKELAKLQAEKDETDAKLKSAFMKGMVALNREAAQALQSGEGGDFNEEAVEELLTGSLSRGNSLQSGQLGAAAAARGSTLRSPAFSDAERRRSTDDRFAPFADMTGYGPRYSVRGKPSTFPVPGVCPVHCTDDDGNFYHKCYAPESCYYGPNGDFEPFEIRVDPKGAPRHVDAGRPYARSSMASSSSLASHSRKKSFK